ISKKVMRSLSGKPQKGSKSARSILTLKKLWKPRRASLRNTKMLCAPSPRNRSQMEAKVHLLSVQEVATKIRWLTVREVRAFHDLALSEHGGMPGLRDPGLLESAVFRRRTAYEYGVTELAELAAKLAFGIASNHAFFDGNKRTALLASLTFLRLNGKQFTASESEIATLLIDTANREISEEELIHWFKQKTE